MEVIIDCTAHRTDVHAFTWYIARAYHASDVLFYFIFIIIIIITRTHAIACRKKKKKKKKKEKKCNALRIYPSPLVPFVRHEFDSVLI